MLNKILKIGFALSIIFFISSVAFGMNDDDFPNEKTSLLHLQKGDIIVVLDENTKIPKKSATFEQWTKWNKYLNEKMIILRPVQKGISLQTSLVHYTKEHLKYDSEKKESELSELNRPFIVLHNLESIFDEQMEPRRFVKCCHPYVLRGLEVVGGLAGWVVFGLIKSGITNGILGKFFKYPDEAAASNIMIGLAYGIDGPHAALRWAKFISFLLKKKRTTLQPIQDKEVGKIFTQARLFKKSKVHQALEYALVPASGVHAFMPTGLWLYLERFFPAIDLSIAGVLLIDSSQSYYAKGKEVLGKLFAEYYYSTHDTKEIRRALDSSLEALSEMLVTEKVKKGTQNGLLKKIWYILKDRSRNFGKKGEVGQLDEEDMISAISALFTRPIGAEDPKNEQDSTVNERRSRYLIKDKPFKDKVAEQCAHFLMAVNFLPGFWMEGFSAATALQVVHVPKTPAEIIGYVLAGLASTRLLIEDEFHQQTFKGIAHPFTPNPHDNLVGRTSLKVYAGAYSLFNASIFLVLYYWSIQEFADPLLYAFMPFILLRYVSLFYNLSSETYNDTVTKIQTRDVEKPTLEQKYTKVNHFIRKAKKLVTTELSNETILDVSKPIFRKAVELKEIKEVVDFKGEIKGTIEENELRKNFIGQIKGKIKKDIKKKKIAGEIIGNIEGELEEDLNREFIDFTEENN